MTTLHSHPTSSVEGGRVAACSWAGDLECARLESLIGATRAGDGGALVLRGVPGAGKSALLDFAAGRAEGLTVLRAGGIPGEAEVAFAGLLEVLRPVLDRLRELPGPQHDALGGALGLVPAVERDRFLVGAATLGLLLLASAERPVLVCVDDAQWLDTPSLDALVFAGRRLAGAPVGDGPGGARRAACRRSTPRDWRSWRCRRSTARRRDCSRRG